MELKEITCILSRTINLGNYESLRVEWSETILVPKDEQDKATSARQDLRDAVKRELTEAIKQAMPSGGRRAERS